MAQLIGLCGLAGSGKSAAADYLITRHGFARVKLAAPLKAALAAIGLTDREIEGDLKEVPSAKLCGKTPRFAMQMLGTNFGRDMIGPSIWTDAWSREAKADIAIGFSVVCDDVRFQNEVEAVRALGGVIVRIVRPGAAPCSSAGHISERQDFDVDAVIVNDSDLAGLYRQIDALLARRGLMAA